MEINWRKVCGAIGIICLDVVIIFTFAFAVGPIIESIFANDLATGHKLAGAIGVIFGLCTGPVAVLAYFRYFGDR